MSTFINLLHTHVFTTRHLHTQLYNSLICTPKTFLYNHLFLCSEYSYICQLIYIHNTFTHQPIRNTTFIYTGSFAYTFACLSSLGSFLLEMRVLSLFAARAASVDLAQLHCPYVHIVAATVCESLSGLPVFSTTSLIPTDSCLASGLPQGSPTLCNSPPPVEALQNCVCLPR